MTIIEISILLGGLVFLTIDLLASRHYNWKKIKTLILFLFILPTFSNSQNLISNSSFERHVEFIKNAPPHSNRGFNYVKDWSQLGWQSVYCNNNIIDTKGDWQWTLCDFLNYKAKSGNSFIKINFEYNCPNDQLLGEKTRKISCCTSYIFSKLTKPLEIGQNYEISFWIFLPSSNNQPENISKNIGFVLTLDKPYMTVNNMLDYEFFFHDSIVCNQWFNIKKYIKALCPLEYIIIGAFRNERFPSNTIHNDKNIENSLFYLIDDISLIQINDENTNNKSITIIPYCKYTSNHLNNKLPINNDTLILYYNSNEYNLDSIKKLKINNYFEKHDINMVYEINGHTDNTGNENQMLSVNRAQEIKNYLEINNKTLKYNIIAQGFSNTRPKVINYKSNQNKLNRRVEIYNSEINSSQFIFNLIIDSIKNNQNSEIKILINKWIKYANDNEKINLIFDSIIKNSKRYNEICKMIKLSYGKNKNYQLAFSIDSINYILKNQIGSGDCNFVHVNPCPETDEYKGYFICENSTESKNSLISTLYKSIIKNGWPKIKDVGTRMSNVLTSIFLISTNINELSSILEILEAECLKGEAFWTDYAMVLDKLYYLQKKPQIFGSLYVKDKDNSFYLYNIKNIDSVNISRSKIGLSKLNNVNQISK